MPETKLDICAFCSAPTWCYASKKGPMCGACRVVRFFRNSLFAPLGFTLLPWQEHDLRAIYGPVDIETGAKKIRRAYIEVAKKNGKALAITTPVPTPGGWKLMADLIVGDKVFDERGEQCNVIAASNVMMGRPCYEVNFSDGSSVVADEEHEWLTRSRQPARTCLRTTARIRETLRIETPGSAGANHSMRLAGPLQTAEVPLPIPPYTLGAWLGDGTSSVATFTSSLEDSQIVEEIQREGVAAHRFKAGATKTAFSYRLGGRQGHGNCRDGSSLQSLLRRLGLLGNKHIPDRYLRAAVWQRLALFQGLMDTDGCVSRTGTACEFTNTNKTLADGFMELAISLGFKPRLRTDLAKLRGRVIGPKYRIQFAAFDDFPCFRLERKRRRLLAKTAHRHRSQSRQIISVSPVPCCPVRCIQVDSPSHQYLAGPSMVPTHNSFLIAGLPIYHLTMEDVERPEAYGVAAAKDQAAIVYRAAAQFVSRNPLLKEKLKVLPSTRRIISRDGNGFYAVLSADGDLQDGVNPSFTVIDELHRWRNAKARTLHDVLIGGTVSRPEPLTVEITTAGDVYDSPLCWETHERARQILEGSLKSDSFFAAIYGADPEKHKEDPNYWQSREARVAANPSHEDNGGFLKDAAIVSMLDELGEAPYRRYHLNLWGQKADRWMDMGAWKRCGGPLRPLMDRECWPGLDLSKTTDLTSLILTFPDTDGSLDVKSFFWLPEGRIAKLERRLKVPLARWIREGLIETTPGDVLDYEAVRKKIHWCAENFHIQEICFDPWNATQFITSLIDEGFRCVEIRQGPQSLSAPMKFLLEKTLSGQLRHEGNEVLTWNADCVSVRTDVIGNIAPAKDKLEKDGKRIDGISALITALARVAVLRSSMSQWTKGEVVI